MSYPQTLPAQIVNIPARGMNTQDSPLSMPPDTSMWLQDVDIDGQKISVRNGFELFGSIVYNSVINALGVWGDPATSSSKLFAYCTSGGTNTVQLGNGDGTFAIAFTCGGSASDDIYPVNYKNNLAFLTEAGNPTAEDARTADGSTWAASGFTYGAANIEPRAGCEYKGRVYLMNGSNLYYSALGAVTGACSLVSLSDFFDYTCYPAFVMPLSGPGELNAETYLVIGSTSGEILLYAGDYPASATWALVGRYKVPPTCGSKSILKLNSDIWIPTIGGIVSLRALMSAGTEALGELSPTYQIQKYWNALMAAYAATGKLYSGYRNVSSAYWPEKNKVFIFIPHWVARTSPLAFDYSDSTIGTLLVYDIPSKGWVIHKIAMSIMTKDDDVTNTTYGDLTYWKNNVYFHCGPNVYRYSTGYVDSEDPTRGADTPAYVWIIEGAYSTLGDPSSQKTVKGWNPLLKQDNCSGSIELYTALDVSRVETSPSAPAMSDGINNLTVLNGGIGTIVQWVMRGTTNDSITGPVELYSMGVIK